MSSLVGLFAECQHAALALLAGQLNSNFEGLSAASRVAKKHGLISAATAKQLVRLDGAAHWARHISRQKADLLIRELRTELKTSATRDEAAGEYCQDRVDTAPQDPEREQCGE